MPSLRTVQELMRQYAPRDSSGPWRVATATPEEVEIVSPIAKWAINGGKRLTNRQAEYILKIHSCFATGSSFALVFADAYVSCEDRKLDTDLLDLALHLRPWESERSAQWFLRQVGDDWSSMIEVMPVELFQELGQLLYPEINGDEDRIPDIAARLIQAIEEKKEGRSK